MTSDTIASPTVPGGHPALDPTRPPLGGGRVLTVALGSLALESGASLPEFVVAYRHDGQPPPAPQALVIHALTGSADAAGDWWEPLIGPGRGLDTRVVGVTCANLVGGCYGTTGPRATDPRTGREYGAAFPPISTRDQARAQWALLDALGVERLALVTGGSLGGMVALEVALERPNAVDALVPIAAPAATESMALAWNAIQVELVDRLGDDGLDLARRLAMTTYRSELDFEERFGRSVGHSGRFSIVEYLEHQGRKLVDRFDRDSYRTLVDSMDRHDIGRGRGGRGAALGPLGESGARLFGVGIQGDILYGPAQVRRLVQEALGSGVDATYRELRSSKGHDAFLVEWPQLSVIIGEALGIG